MKKIAERLHSGKQTYSFELFPPKTEAGYQKLMETIAQLSALTPDFISCTYGAGGGSRDKTLDIIEHIEKTHRIAGLAHLTCALNTQTQIKGIVEEIQRRGITNVLALRGDPPAEFPDWQPTDENFRYSYELCAFIRKNYGDYFSIGVAGFPEGHPAAPDKDTDARYLKMKIDAGADYVITQLFFDTRDYFDYVTCLKKIGVAVPVIPGILPITNYVNLRNFCERCGARIPRAVHELFSPLQNDPDATLKAGIAFTLRQCAELREGGAPGLHFYPLNKISPVDTIIRSLRK